jgi:hypothetical protein
MIQADSKIQKQLIAELATLHQRMAELEAFVKPNGLATATAGRCSLHLQFHFRRVL